MSIHFFFENKSIKKGLKLIHSEYSKQCLCTYIHQNSTSGMFTFLKIILLLFCYAIMKVKFATMGHLKSIVYEK